MMPLSPTATNWLPFPAALLRYVVTPELRCLQLSPVAEVNNVPPSPTAMNCPSPQAIPARE
jgi:hypothetical protein